MYCMIFYFRYLEGLLCAGGSVLQAVLVAHGSLQPFLLWHWLKLLSNAYIWPVLGIQSQPQPQNPFRSAFTYYIPTLYCTGEHHWVLCELWRQADNCISTIRKSFKHHLHCSAIIPLPVHIDYEAYYVLIWFYLNVFLVEKLFNFKNAQQHNKCHVKQHLRRNWINLHQLTRQQWTKKIKPSAQ